MGKHLSETLAILRWKHATAVFAFLALVSASAALAIPGPGGSTSGFASVLLVGALVLFAGQVWGTVIVGASQLLVLGATWPVLFSDASTVERSLATLVAMSALPGLLLFAATLPFAVEVIIGRGDSWAQRHIERALALSGTFWLAHPLVF